MCSLNSCGRFHQRRFTALLEPTAAALWCLPPDLHILTCISLRGGGERGAEPPRRGEVAGSAPVNLVARRSKPITVRGGRRLTSIIYVSQPLSPSSPERRYAPGPRCPRRPGLDQLNSLSQDPCTSPSSHGEDTRSKQLLHIPDGRARQMSKENQRERQGKVYEPAFANLNVNLCILSSKTECSWRNSWPCPV